MDGNLLRKPKRGPHRWIGYPWTACSVMRHTLSLSLIRSRQAFNKHTLDTPFDSPLTRFPFAALERTFLGYLRTSLALSFVAVIIAQLFRLQHVETPDKIIGYHELGIPLASVCIVASMVVLLLGAVRFWRQQNAILRGKVHAGGWEINAIGVIVFLVGGMPLQSCASS